MSDPIETFPTFITPNLVDLAQRVGANYTEKFGLSRPALQGHSRSLEPIRIDRLGNIAKFPQPRTFNAPVDGVPIGILQRRWVQKNYDEKALGGDAIRSYCALGLGGAKNFRPAADTLPEGAGRPKFNQLEMVTTFTQIPSLVRIDRYTQFRVIAVTDPRTNKQPQTHAHTGPITIHCAPASAQRNDGLAARKS